MKKLFFNILAVAIVLGGAYMSVQYFQTSKQNKIDNDNSYKVITSRDKSYNGVYTLTKLDDNGNNTWCGLILYVKNDKIISGGLVEAESIQEIRDREFNGDKTVSEDKIIEKTSLKSQVSWNSEVVTGFTCVGGGLSRNEKGQYIVATIGEFEFYDKDVVLDKDYDNLVRCKILAGYDENSKEIWLSKLLKNEQSEFSTGYKLIHYNSYIDVDKNCPIEVGGECIRNLNTLFNARLNGND